MEVPGCANVAGTPQFPNEKTTPEGVAFGQPPNTIFWQSGHNWEMSCSLSVGVRSGIAF